MALKDVRVPVFITRCNTNIPLLVSDTAIDFQGLTVVQVSQNQAAVVSDPQNRIFVVKNSGFVAYAIDGTYDVLAIVDQTHLSNEIKDTVTGATLGSCVPLQSIFFMMLIYLIRMAEIRMRSHVNSGKAQEYVVALLFVYVSVPTFLP